VLVAISSGRTSDLAASGASPIAAEVGGIQLGFLIAAATALAASVTALVAWREDAPAAPAIQLASNGNTRLHAPGRPGT
jgi:hypothetical protein